MYKKYSDKLVEVGEKFKAYLAELSQDIAHGTYYQELQLKYSVSIGAGGNVDLSDLLYWINGIALPPIPAPDENVKPSGFLTSVVTRTDQPSHVIRCDPTITDSSGKEDELASFLSRDHYSGLIATSSMQVNPYLY